MKIKVMDQNGHKSLVLKSEAQQNPHKMKPDLTLQSVVVATNKKTNTHKYIYIYEYIQLHLTFSNLLHFVHRGCLYVSYNSGFGGLEAACWPLVPKFAGSNPAEAVGFFRAKKILSTPSFGREVKPFVPCSRFTACKRSLNVTWKSGIFRQNSSTISRPSTSSFHY